MTEFEKKVLKEKLNKFREKDKRCDKISEAGLIPPPKAGH